MLRYASHSSKPRREGTAHDFTVTARKVVEQAIGEKLDGTPLDAVSKNPAAVALGKLGGAKGGKARTEALSRRRRVEIAKAECAFDSFEIHAMAVRRQLNT
jgi:hypothetical protein